MRRNNALLYAFLFTCCFILPCRNAVAAIFIPTVPCTESKRIGYFSPQSDRAPAAQVSPINHDRLTAMLERPLSETELALLTEESCRYEEENAQLEERTLTALKNSGMERGLHTAVASKLTTVPPNHEMHGARVILKDLPIKKMAQIQIIKRHLHNLKAIRTAYAEAIEGILPLNRDQIKDLFPSLRFYLK